MSIKSVLPLLPRNISRRRRMLPRRPACPAMWYRSNTSTPMRQLSIRREREDATQLRWPPMAAAASQRSYSVAKQSRCSPTVLYRLSSFVRDAAAYCRASLRLYTQDRRSDSCCEPRHNHDRHDLHYSLKRDGEKIAVRQGGNPSVVRITFLQLPTLAKVRRQYITTSLDRHKNTHHE